MDYMLESLHPDGQGVVEGDLKEYLINALNELSPAEFSRLVPPGFSIYVGVSFNKNKFTQYQIYSQNKEVDDKLSEIMKSIHAQCVKYGQNGNKIDYIKGANIGGFIKVANAMLDQGCV